MNTLRPQANIRGFDRKIDVALRSRKPLVRRRKSPALVGCPGDPMGGSGPARQRADRRDGLRRRRRALRPQRLHSVVGDARRTRPRAARRDRRGRGPRTPGRGARGARRRRRAPRRRPPHGVRGTLLAGVPAARRPARTDHGCTAGRPRAHPRPRRRRAPRDAAHSRRHAAPPVVGLGARAGARDRDRGRRRVHGIRRADHSLHTDGLVVRDGG